jgi:catalase
MTSEQQQVLFENTARSIAQAPQEIKLRHIVNCTKADKAYGEGVAEMLGL